jgi:hypothetical protein
MSADSEKLGKKIGSKVLKSLSIEHPIPKEVLMTTIWLKDMVQDGGAAANKSHGEAKKCKDYASNKSLLHIITLSINESILLF